MTKGELRAIIAMTVEEMTSELRSAQAQIEVYQMKLKELGKARKGVYDAIKIQQVKYNFLLKEIERKQDER